MAYAVVWKHTEDAGSRKLMVPPETFAVDDTPEKAKQEGRRILGDLAPEQKTAMGVLAVVEVTDEMVYGLQGCERVFLPMNAGDGEEDDELEFIDITQASYWSRYPWWAK